MATKRETDMQIVSKNYPLGTKLRHKVHGGLFELGVKANMREFWVMQCEPEARKGKVTAETLRRDYEVVK